MQLRAEIICREQHGWFAREIGNSGRPMNTTVHVADSGLMLHITAHPQAKPDGSEKVLVEAELLTALPNGTIVILESYEHSNWRWHSCEGECSNPMCPNTGFGIRQSFRWRIENQAHFLHAMRMRQSAAA